MLRPPPWVGRYIGIPFMEHGRDADGLDCWGLVRLILHEQFGVLVPSYTEQYESTRDAVLLGRLIKANMKSWHPVTGAHQEGDVGLFRVRGQPMHVGLVVAPGLMVHSEVGLDSALERYDRIQWGRRLLGMYRNGGLAHGE